MGKSKTKKKVSLPKEDEGLKRLASAAKIGTMKGGVIVHGNIHANRDVIMGNQYNDYRHQLAQIATPQQFIAEAEKMQTQIAEAKKNPAFPPVQRRRIEVVEGDVKEVIEETKKDKPNPKTMSDTLKSAAETMEGVGKAVDAAKGVGEKVDQVVRSIDWGRLAVGATALADLASRIFMPH